MPLTYWIDFALLFCFYVVNAHSSFGGKIFSSHDLQIVDIFGMLRAIFFLDILFHLQHTL